MSLLEKHNNVWPESLLREKIPLFGSAEFLNDLYRTHIAVSSLAEDSMAPALVAPIALEIAKAISKALPAPSCSTETKQGKP